MTRAILFGLLLVASICAADAQTTTTLYKSVGPDGKIVYGDRPPPEGLAAKKMTFENLPASPLSAATLAYIEQLERSNATPVATAPPMGVVLFATAWCGYCKKARAYLASKGIAYREVDIETKGGMAAYAQAGGRKGVPLLLANGRHVLGFSAAAYDSLLATRH